MDKISAKLQRAERMDSRMNNEHSKEFQIASRANTCICYQQDRALKSLPALPPIINALLRLVRRGFFVDFQTVDVPSRRDNMDVNLPFPRKRPKLVWVKCTRADEIQICVFLFARTHTLRQERTMIGNRRASSYRRTNATKVFKKPRFEQHQHTFSDKICNTENPPMKPSQLKGERVSERG